MLYNRSEIMTAAWVIVRRFRGNGEPHRQLMARALRSAWFTAKMEAQAQRKVAEAMEEREALAARAAASLWAQIQDMENRNYLGHDGIVDLSQLRVAYHTAAQREAEEKAAAELAEKRRLIESAGGRFASVVFTKKDGARRQMRVQPAKLKYHVKGDAASDPAQRAVGTRKARHPNLLPVWDVEASAPRSVNLATVSRIAVNGAVHEFRI